MSEAAEGFSPAEETPGVSRREALKKGAVVGGTVLWAAPLVQSLGMSAAAAQTVSPGPGPGPGPGPVPDVKGISFIVFRFSCGGTTYAVKVDSPGQGDQSCGSVPTNDKGQDCGLVVGASDVNGGTACTRFTLSNVKNSGGETVQTTVRLGAGCTFISGYAKWGSDQSTSEPCVPASAAGVFTGCPKS